MNSNIRSDAQGVPPATQPGIQPDVDDDLDNLDDTEETPEGSDAPVPGDEDGSAQPGQVPPRSGADPARH